MAVWVPVVGPFDFDVVLCELLPPGSGCGYVMVVSKGVGPSVCYCGAAGANIGNIQNVMGVLYSATNFQGMFNLMNVRPLFVPAKRAGLALAAALALQYSHPPRLAQLTQVVLTSRRCSRLLVLSVASSTGTLIQDTLLCPSSRMSVASLLIPVAWGCVTRKSFLLGGRERAALMYAHLPYISAVAFVELPYLLAQVLVFVPISYFMIGELLVFLVVR